MNEFAKKAAYLRGYLGALEEELNDERGMKIAGKLLDLIDEMADRIDRLTDKLEDVNDRVEDLELFGYDDDDDDLYELDDDDEFNFEDEELEEADLFEIQCTECGEDFTIDYDDIIGGEGIRCPHCNARIELAIDFEDDEEE